KGSIGDSCGCAFNRFGVLVDRLDSNVQGWSLNLLRIDVVIDPLSVRILVCEIHREFYPFIVLRQQSLCGLEMSPKYCDISLVVCRDLLVLCSEEELCWDPSQQDLVSFSTVKDMLDHWYLIVNILLGAESEIVQDQDLAGLDLGNSLPGMRTHHIFHKLHILIAE